MAQSEKDIKSILEKALENPKTSISFNLIWAAKTGEGNSKKIKLFMKKKFILAFLVSIIMISVFAAGVFAGYFINEDKIDYPFVKDRAIIGKWQSVGLVENIKDFKLGHKSSKDDLYLSYLVFVNYGKVLYSNNKGDLCWSLKWTKGLVLNARDETASHYEIKKLYGNDYMFFEWKSGDYIFRDMKQLYYVLKRIDSHDYSNLFPTAITINK